MASIDFRVTVRINRPRLRAILEETVGQLKRAPRRDRPAIVDRCYARAKRLCLRVT